MKVSNRQISTWSKMGSRAAYGLGLLDLAKQEPNLLVVTPDTSTSAGLDRFRKKLPTQFFEVGIAEQNGVGIAAGLASEGYRVFMSTFAPFQTMRCCEQIKVNLCYMNNSVTLVGLASGVVLSMLGYTHCAIEDLAIMRALPNMTVLSPADPIETVKLAWASYEMDGPVYLRLSGDAKSPVVYNEDYDLEIGKAIQLKEGTDIAIIATGTMVAESLAAADSLSNDVSTAVYNMHTIKPIDEALIHELAKNYKLVLTVEEHSRIGGLGSAVAEVMTEIPGACPQLIMGLHDSYAKSGDYREVLAASELSSDGIERMVRTYLNAR